MDNNIPELKKDIWKLVEACATLSNRSTVSIFREFTTSMSSPDGKTFNELKNKWSLCSFRTKIDKYYHEFLGYNIFKWYREGIIEKNPPETIHETKIVTEQKEYAPPKLANGFYDTWGT